MLFQEARLQLKRQEPVHPVKHIRISGETLPSTDISWTRRRSDCSYQATSWVADASGVRNRNTRTRVKLFVPSEAACPPAGGVRRRGGEQPIGESTRFPPVNRRQQAPPFEQWAGRDGKPINRTRPSLAFLAQVA